MNEPAPDFDAKSLQPTQGSEAITVLQDINRKWVLVNVWPSSGARFRQEHIATFVGGLDERMWAE